MKRIILAHIAVLLCITLFAQTDTTKQSTADTIRIGGMVIIKRANGNEGKKQTTITIGNRRRQRSSNISTAHWIIDFGFANYTDKTDYASAALQNYIVNKPGSSLGKNDFKLKTGKSSNINLWFFMQRINLIKQYVNLKYGLGVELNNYRFKTPLSFNEGGPNPYNPSQNIPHSFVFKDSISFSKNKLAIDYVTVPLMLNFCTNPDYSKKGLSISAGISMGYLYSARNKQISNERGKDKTHGDFDVKKWKFSYIGELGLGPTRLYGSYTPKSLFENGLNLMPYTVGVRISNW
ncbi:MAG: outer membrane beta-barrel protein [Ginsengibacter sp.]